MKTNRIERLLELIQALESGREGTPAALAKQLKVSERTVYRDLSLLARAGIVYSFDRSAGRFTMGEASILPPLSFTHAEVLVLMMATRQLLTHGFITDREAAASAGLKIESTLPQAIRDHCGSVLEHIEFLPDSSSATEPVHRYLPTLQTALTRRAKIRVRYHSYYEQAVLDLTLHIYRLAYIHRGWYLIAYTETADRVQTYKVERIVELDMLSQTYRIAREFSLDDYFGHAWLMIPGQKRHHVRIRFGVKVARNVAEIAWHKTQRTTFEPDGTLLFEAEVDGVSEIAWWVLGYGAEAEVLEPDALREIIAEHAEKVVARYNGRGDKGEPTQGG